MGTFVPQSHKYSKRGILGECVYYIGFISNHIDIEMPKVIIVTGGAGFLGRNLCNKLLQDENNRVICIDNLVTGRTKNITEIRKKYSLSE